MGKTIQPWQRIYVALDTTDVARAVDLAAALKGLVGGVKIGKEFFTANGPEGVHAITKCGMPLFLDLKFHDIPNTVGSAIRAAMALNPFMVNVHACGGRRMMEAAANAARETSVDEPSSETRSSRTSSPDTRSAHHSPASRPLVLGVTVLTSMDQSDLAEIGVDVDPLAQVLRLATLAHASGLDGVVCSAKEVTALRKKLGPDFKLVVPGIRPTWAATDDQRRIVTPKDAVDLGADYLVIGRPITGHKDPQHAARLIGEELSV